MVPRVVSWGWKTAVTTAREGPTCSVTSGLKSYSIASCPYNLLTGPGAPVPLEAPAAGSRQAGPVLLQSQGGRFEGRDSGLLSCDCPVVKRPSCSWKGGKCQRQASWLHELLGRSEPSSSSTLPPVPSAVPPGVACSSCSSLQAQRPQPCPPLRSPSPLASPFMSAKCHLPPPGRGLSLCLNFLVGERPGEQPPPDSQPRGLDQSWGHLWPSSPEPLRKRMEGAAASTLWSWSDLGQG